MIDNGGHAVFGYPAADSAVSVVINHVATTATL